MRKFFIVLVLLNVLVLIWGYLAQHKSADSAISPIENVTDSRRLSLADLPIEGASDARIVLVEFSDYECPFCSQHANTVLPKLRQEFIETGKLRYAFANTPLAIHPSARMLAIAAICAGPDHYWVVHDELFRGKPRTKDEVLALLNAMKINLNGFGKCFDSPAAPALRINADIERAEQLGLNATPSFVLGISDGLEGIQVRKIIRGTQPFSEFEILMRELLNPLSSGD